MNVIRVFYIFILIIIISSCHPRSCILEPKINYIASKRHIESLPSAFKEIDANLDWEKEIKIGQGFAKELDLYRAITAFKRSLILMPNDQIERRLQVEFYIVKAYWLGQKYESAIEAFEFSHLPQATGSFDAFSELIQILYDCYEKLGASEKASCILELIEKGNKESALDLNLYSLINKGDIFAISTLSKQHTKANEFDDFISTFCRCKKSVRKAQTLNALMPGAGYYYVGQKKSALTSFTINTLFIAAAYHFFDRGNWAAGLITASLEFGWYFGGINGSGLAAKEYNDCLYNNLGKDLMIRNKLFPVLMLETSF